jgi:hypothetical protein
MPLEGIAFINKKVSSVKTYCFHGANIIPFIWFFLTLNIIILHFFHNNSLIIIIFHKNSKDA